MTQKYLQEYPITGALEAGKAILEIYEASAEIEVTTKDDNCLLYTSDAADEHRDVVV